MTDTGNIRKLSLAAATLLVQTAFGSAASSTNGALNDYPTLTQTTFGSSASSATGSGFGLKNLFTQTTFGSASSSTTGAFSAAGVNLVQTIPGSLTTSAITSGFTILESLLQTVRSSAASQSFGHFVADTASVRSMSLTGITPSTTGSVRSMRLAAAYPPTTGRVYGMSFANTTVASVRSLTFSAINLLAVTTNGDLVAEPGDTLTLIGTCPGTVDAWTVTQISGPAVSILGAGATKTVRAPYTLTTSVVVLQWQASQGATVSDPVTQTITTYPQQHWYLTTGGSWQPRIITAI